MAKDFKCYIFETDDQAEVSMKVFVFLFLIRLCELIEIRFMKLLFCGKILKRFS